MFTCPVLTFNKFCGGFKCRGGGLVSHHQCEIFSFTCLPSGYPILRRSIWHRRRAFITTIFFFFSAGRDPLLHLRSRSIHTRSPLAKLGRRRCQYTRLLRVQSRSIAVTWLPPFPRKIHPFSSFSTVAHRTCTRSQCYL